ncbi:DUF6082 family protein [Streptomyces cellulosae]|jgi:hypothetical protein|uniref:Secreted protein n=1 Tax=Streptomyces thermodiastaticus TaxID=44061 RepID=A0ABU0K9R0_9ACTN|nr:hypothetical protein [Streptomyces thermodiastaticus]UVT12187.1 hypothetical protein AY578_24730 [Streptomyces thermocarboxydus]WSB43963.1 DUF6082 family protein [Streptomyces cellulosae]WTF22967.1 DUF6082 family protein [Streptomyces cellulosae]
MGTKSVGLRRLHSVTAAGLGMVAGVIAAVAAQRGTLDAINRRLERLEEQASNQQRANLAMQQRQHWELLSKAIDDPELAEVLDLYEVPVTTQKRRQYLFANAAYTNLLNYHRIGNLTLDEFFKHARALFQNAIVRDYWEATRHDRDSLEGTEEAKIAQMIDELLLQLDEADTGEWWVVGEPPTDQ